MKSFKEFVNEHWPEEGGEGHEHDGYGEHSHEYDNPAYNSPFGPYGDTRDTPWKWDPNDHDGDGIPNDEDPDYVPWDEYNPDHPDYVPPGPFGPFYPNPSYPGDQQDPHYIV